MAPPKHRQCGARGHEGLYDGPKLRANRRASRTRTELDREGRGQRAGASSWRSGVVPSSKTDGSISTRRSRANRGPNRTTAAQPTAARCRRGELTADPNISSHGQEGPRAKPPRASRECRPRGTPSHGDSSRRRPARQPPGPPTAILNIWSHLGDGLRLSAFPAAGKTTAVVILHRLGTKGAAASVNLAAPRRRGRPLAQPPPHLGDTALLGLDQVSDRARDAPNYGKPDCPTSLQKGPQRLNS